MADIPGNSSTTSSLTVGGSVSDTLELLGDHDWFRISLTAGQSITVFVDGITLEDPYVYIRNAAGTVLFENDDINPGINRDSSVSFSAPSSGTYYIDVGAWDEGYTGNYQVSVSVYSPPPLATLDQIANQLVEGYWGGDDHHFNVGQGGSITVNITALTAPGQNLAREALKLWSDIIGVQFVEVSIGGQITFDDNQQGAATDSNWSNGIITSAHVNVSTQWLANYGTAINSYSLQTYIHEIGHALGLGHAGNYNGSANYPYDASFQNDAWATSIMSYFSQTENTYFAGQGFTENYIVTPMLADIIAMSTLYGLSTTTRTGDTIYGFNSNAGRAEYNASQNPSVAYTIFDSGGNDTLDYSGFADNQTINLNAEAFSNVGGEIGNVAIARTVVIENAIGGSGSDSITGNSFANLLTGNGGNDILNGGAGADTLIGGIGNDSYVIDQVGDVVSELAGQGEDMVIAKASFVLGAGVSVETMTTINGSATTAINLTGNEFAQSLYGNAGNNVLTGMGGSDYLVGGAGNDQYYVDASDFIAESVGGGDDTIKVATTYILREGNEIETLVAVNQASFDPVNLSGNEFGQSLYGSQGANSLNGNGGNDFLVGLGGNDFLLGGAGNDNMAGGQGNDIYYAQDSGDWVMEASAEGDDLVVAFDHYALRAGESIETLSAAEGTAAIILTGNGLAQSIYGNAGANILTSGGGADYLVGGAGNDVFALSNAAGVATVADYAAGDVVDISQFLAVANGTNVVTGGYLKIVGSQLQVDLNGGGDSWTTVANVSGSGSVTLRYLSGGASTDLAVARSASQSTMMAAAVAAVGMAVLPGDDTKAPADTGSQDAPATGSSPAMLTVYASPLAASADVSRPLLADKPHGADSLPDRLSIVGKEALVADHHPTAPVEAAAPLAALPDADLAAVAAPASQLALAHGIAMPSAELLLAAASVDAGAPNATAEVARVLLDALAGDGVSRPIDTLLDALPANGGPTGIEHLAANLDTGHGAAFTGAAFHPAFALDLLHALAAHPDATTA